MFYRWILERLLHSLRSHGHRTNTWFCHKSFGFFSRFGQYVVMVLNADMGGFREMVVGK